VYVLWCSIGSRLFVRLRLRLLQMKVAAAERPAKSDSDQVNRNDIVQHSRHHKSKNAAHLRSHCACLIGLCWPICLRNATQTLRSTKSMRATTRMSPSMPPPMYMLSLQIVRLSEHWNIKTTRQSGRYRTQRRLPKTNISTPEGAVCRF